MKHCKNQFTVIAMKPEDGFYYHEKITFNTTAENISDAVYSLVSKRIEFQRCFFLELETLAPITFDTTVYLKGGNFEKTGNPYPNDIFACTYDEFKSMLISYSCRPELLHSFSKRSFCRVIRSKGGKAGEFFMMHNKRFREERIAGALHLQEKQPLQFKDFEKSFHKGCYLNSPEHYFKK
ncbi:hypothetical protein [Vibrio harveyi]|uniref:hypothetical protein n=1 Tax=Vibrio harveyi TaxID=669 RepID=UPI003D7085B8